MAQKWNNQKGEANPVHAYQYDDVNMWLVPRPEYFKPPAGTTAATFVDPRVSIFQTLINLFSVVVHIEKKNGCNDKFDPKKVIFIRKIVKNEFPSVSDWWQSILGFVCFCVWSLTGEL